MLLFLLIWIVGMIAMMFPAVIPVTSIYNATIAKSTPHSVVGSAFFLTGYLATYLLLGVAACLGVMVVTIVASTMPFLWNYGTLAFGAVLVATGLWQLTPFKNACLKNCVSPPKKKYGGG